jgi:hypothetical protein
MALAEHYGITYENPAGGCLLTEPGYSARLRRLLDRPELLTGRNASLIRHGRMFLMGDGVIGLVGRSESDNAHLEAMSEPDRAFVTPDVPGPTGVIIGPKTPRRTSLLGSLIALYAKRPPGEEVVVRSLSGEEHRVAPMDPTAAGSMMVKA